ncbi:helix-turn-helix domain-containing protein [Sphingobacterium cavernae]|uniref:helix-turn-helix domain-containing protein n=1 Tax=Sphingobacterium cavernae TaxID=2592657 RepID=UPI00122FBC91|nr:helix-turn-helix domain-containing protein [Sphingobacterium cavernae]
MKTNLIISTVSEALNISVDTILNKGRKTDQLYARYITIAILREEGYSTNEIAILFNNYTRNCIANHCTDVFKELIAYNRVFKDMYLQAVKAVEDLDYESENESPAA